jgi:hypothetical protein
MIEKMLMLANKLKLTKNVFVAGQKQVETNFSRSEFDKNMSNIIELIVRVSKNNSKLYMVKENGTKHLDFYIEKNIKLEIINIK